MNNAHSAKARAVEAMFSSIARWYDFLNHLLSFGFDIAWRKRATACFGDLAGKAILDIACGTGDLAIAVANAGDDATSVIGGDFSGEMLAIGNKKVEKRGLGHRVRFEVADALDLPYPDERFDGVACAFGVRNFADLDRGLAEMFRTLAPGGRMVVLEFTTPGNRLIAAVYRLYFTRILPAVGGLISGDRHAYEYLPNSVYHFPSPEKLTARLERLGLEDVEFIPLTLGICGIHTGVKRRAAA